jgi:hypothetical protein
MIASVRLNRLHCNAENASEGATPYAWVEILAINDDTLRSSALVAGVGFVPAPLGAQLVIQNGMRAGDNASVPEALQRFDVGFRSDQLTRELIVVVALLDKHDVPGSAILAGYIVFLSIIREQIAAHIGDFIGLGNIPNPTDRDSAQQIIVNEITAVVKTKVLDAIKEHLSALDLGAIALGLDERDELIGAQVARFTVTEVASTTPLKLAIGAGTARDYQVDGELVVTANPCEDQIARVRLFQRAIENIQGALRQGASAPEGPGTEKRIEKLQKDLAAQSRLLATAKAELEDCRVRNGGIPAASSG